jgi:hypothetical protein
VCLSGAWEICPQSARRGISKLGFRVVRLGIAATAAATAEPLQRSRMRCQTGGRGICGFFLTH